MTMKINYTQDAIDAKIKELAAKHGVNLVAQEPASKPEPLYKQLEDAYAQKAGDNPPDQIDAHIANLERQMDEATAQQAQEMTDHEDERRARTAKLEAAYWAKQDREAEIRSMMYWQGNPPTEPQTEEEQLARQMEVDDYRSDQKTVRIAGASMAVIRNMIGNDDDDAMNEKLMVLALLSGDEALMTMSKSTRLNAGVFMDALGEVIKARAAAWRKA